LQRSTAVVATYTATVCAVKLWIALFVDKCYHRQSSYWRCTWLWSNFTL